MDEKADIEKIVGLLRSRLSKGRFEHSIRVAETASKLGQIYGQDQSRLLLAGLIHDMAKSLDDATLLAIAEQEGLISHESERLIPDLLHAPVAAVIARNELGIADEQVLAGMANHTLGRPGMSDFEKIVFLADMIEPGRSYPGMEELAELTERDLDAAMLSGLDSTIAYCIKRGRILHPRTVDTRNYFLTIVKADKKED